MSEIFTSESELNVDKIASVIKSKSNKFKDMFSKIFKGGVTDEPVIYRIELSDNRGNLYMQILPALNPPDKSEKLLEDKVVNEEKRQKQDLYNELRKIIPDMVDNTQDREENDEKDRDNGDKNESNYAEITIEYLNPKTNKKELVEKYDNVEFLSSNIKEIVDKYINKYKNKLGTSSYAKIYEVKDSKSSKKLNVKLSKITSDESIDIELVSVNCNYSPVLALEDLGYALEDPDVISMIPDDGYATLSIVPSEDSLDIDVCEESACEVDTLSKFSTIIRPLVITRYNLMSIQNNVYGSEQEIVRDKCVSLMWTLDDMMNSMSSLCIQYLGYFPNPLSFISTEGLVNLSETIECEYALNSIRTSLLELVSAVDLYYCDMPHEIQSLYDGWLISLNAAIGAIRP